MKFEVGKFYRTRGGDKVVYVGENTYNDVYPHIFGFSEQVVLMRTDDGEALEGDKQEDDIIGEWVDSVKCWIGYCPFEEKFYTTTDVNALHWWHKEGYEVQEVTFNNIQKGEDSE